MINVLEGPENLPKCLEIRKRVFVEEQGVPLDRELDAYDVEAAHFLALLDGEAVGVGRLRLVEGLVKFERVATLREARGRGVASALLKKMEEVAGRRHPGLKFKMEAQVAAIGLYEKLGWSSEGEIFQDAGIDHILMTK